VILNYDTADEEIVRLRRKGIDVYWRGYDIVIFVPDRSAMYNSQGVLRGDTYGFETVYGITEQGQWQIELPAKRTNRRNKRVSNA
jgi:hypothetical protein